MSSMSVRIRRARTQSALTQSELSRRLGVQRSAVTQWEREAGTTPNVEHLARIACETRVCFEWLATGRGPCRADAEAFTEAVLVHDIARDELESRALVAMRRITRRRREALVTFIENMAS